MVRGTESELVAEGTPAEVRDRVLEERSRAPVTDSTLGLRVESAGRGDPPNRLVVVGDSLSHGFQSGAVFNTDISYPAIIAYELGWFDSYRYPRYPGMGGLPLNIELIARDLESRFGSSMNLWEEAQAMFAIRDLMDRIEDYWERGSGTVIPRLSAYQHALAVYGWDLRDSLSKTAKTCRDAIRRPNDDVIKQVVENDSERAALRVYPTTARDSNLSLLDVATALGADHDTDTDCGIETLIVFLGSNNALQSVTRLEVRWSGEGYDDLGTKGRYTVWQPQHFAAELSEVAAKVRDIKARHVIWVTVPHVTIAPIARGVGDKIVPGSRYFPYYTRPWIKDADFNPAQDPNITGAQARAVDTAIDMYNESIELIVRQGRDGTYGEKLDWHLFDVAGILDRLANRRYIADPGARPDWWTEYPLPPALQELKPLPDSRFLTGDGKGGRATGGLFSLDGVHPTTVGYGIIAQELITIMAGAGVVFTLADGTPRPGPVSVDFARLLRRDTLINRPPQNLTQGLEILGWADETIDWVKRALSFRLW